MSNTPSVKVPVCNCMPDAYSSYNHRKFCPRYETNMVKEIQRLTTELARYKESWKDAEPPEGFPLLSVRKLLDDYKQLESAQAWLQSLIRETLIEKAELESLINDERRKYNMNREEFESVQNANGEYIHTLKESLDNERTWRKQAESKLPEELFGGYAVYNETKFAAPMIAPDDVSIVLDAVVKLIKQRVSAKPKGEL